MWPFRKKPYLPGIKRHKDDSATIELTEEEQHAISVVARAFEGYGIHRDCVVDIQNAVTARGLSFYAREQVYMSEMESQKENRIKLLEKALAAIMKIFSFYDLPIYFYDMACLMEMLGRFDLAENGFREFLKRQSKYKPRPADAVLLSDRDIDEAIKDARTKAKVI
jgi:hypothetical protein